MKWKYFFCSDKSWLKTLARIPQRATKLVKKEEKEMKQITKHIDELLCRL
jgi:hypothetical protein